MQIHACLLALRTGRPVKMSYGREESFFGHVHRHPARMTYEHGATRDGDLVYVRARIVLDGGAYASTSSAVCSNATSFACGPYEVPNADLEGFSVYTDNPPCGAMRGFGAVQVAFAYEAQMDKLATALGMDPVELRLRNAVREGSTLPTGQVIRGPAPVRELLERLRLRPLPPPAAGTDLPGGAGRTTRGEGVRRGVGYAVGIKNIAYSESFDDFATARVRLSLGADGEPLAEVHSAASEVGQGVAGVQAQIARTELGVERVEVLAPDTRIGTAGSSSASRQTYMTGGAVKLACEAVREELAARAERLGEDDLAALLAEGPVEATREHHHAPTQALDERGQGDAHLAFAFAAHRAVVDVDTELGVARVAELAAAQDVGRAINPQAVEGQIHGGSLQGLGLALMEEVQVRDGEVLTASFTDYHIPTMADAPALPVDVLECPDPQAPYGVRGVGEPPTISSTPAVVAGLRAATGRPLTRVPVRPDDMIGL
jgi:CO/xanthine dehydrogenase Mo-binding subunit